MAKKALMAIGAHADDIELNVGGTLLKYRALGYEIVYVMSTNNISGEWKTLHPDGSVTSRKPPWHEIMPQRKREAAAAAAMFGTTPIHLDHSQRHYTRDDGTVAELRYGCERPDGVQADVPTIITAYEHGPSVQQLADLIVEKNPEAVITHGVAAGDVEHFATSLLTAKAFRKAAEAGCDGRLMQWPELGGGAFSKLNLRWDTFVDVSEYWDGKLKAVGLHACQMPRPEQLDFPEWGPACGCGRAEVFTVVAGDAPPDPHASFSLEILAHMR